MSEKVRRVVDLDYYGQQIGELPKIGRRNPIKVFVRDFEGRRFIELRKWSEWKLYSGPGKQGITLLSEEVEALTDLLKKARDKLEQGGKD